ncbi:hypothetical protein Dda_6481 [Drechslerella dactyloides]|uniref:PAS domain-containing protein n=1 Tax=Drechslerella dactyloides TaxID=74499 RepID=A0AAD6IU24_DREDA|nr:hypothetical protein Dda_6481 [Drechslerella dactyloides]
MSTPAAVAIAMDGVPVPSGSGAAAMEKTFITMHDLSADARIVYASDSVADVLGYPPEDVVGLSCFDFFHPDELPFARKVHTRGIHLDRAAVLAYCRVKHKDGGFVNCETIFSVVYDVFVAATTVHVQTSKSQGRALTAPVIRRVFSSSPNDPRYHMLTHLSTKFRMESSHDQGSHEPRVALILNRFTRSLTILYVSHASQAIFGLHPEDLAGKSFFECIHPDCLQEAVDALERAKENDSIAYLRFQWRDPVNPDADALPPPPPPPEQQQPPPQPAPERSLRRSQRISSLAKRKFDAEDSPAQASSSSSSGRPAKRSRAMPRGEASLDAGLSRPAPPEEGGSSRALDVSNPQQAPASRARIAEAEAVVSCTSDGLVVILRQARPLIPKPLHNVPSSIFASPWAPVPLVPSVENAPDKSREISFMEAIREVAVFAWSLRQLGGEIISNPENDGASESDEKKLDLEEEEDEKDEKDEITRAASKGKAVAAVASEDATPTPSAAADPSGAAASVSSPKAAEKERRGRPKSNPRRQQRR